MVSHGRGIVLQSGRADSVDMVAEMPGGVGGQMRDNVPMKMAWLRLADTLIVFALTFASLAARAQESGYDQPYRPQVHFSPREHWTNDPNGLVFFHGEYHLFFQFNPFGDEWGHMSWGHAVSKDLLHWQELPVAIPEKDGEMVFTGSVVVDHEKQQRLLRTRKRVSGCGLHRPLQHERKHVTDAEPGIQSRRRTNLDPLCRKPGARSAHGRLPRPERVMG